MMYNNGYDDNSFKQSVTINNQYDSYHSYR